MRRHWHSREKADQRRLWSNCQTPWPPSRPGLVWSRIQGRDNPLRCPGFQRTCVNHAFPLLWTCRSIPVNCCAWAYIESEEAKTWVTPTSSTASRSRIVKLYRVSASHLERSGILRCGRILHSIHPTPTTRSATFVS